MGKKHTTQNKLQSSIVSSPSSFFTLVEMLVALALGVIILAVAVTAFQQGGAVSRVSHAKTEAVHNARVALQMIGRDLESAYIEPTGNTFIGIDDGWTWDGENYHDDELYLLSLAGQGGASSTDLIEYKIIKDESGIFTAQQEELPFLGRSHDGGSNWDSVGDGIRSFNVRYYYDGEWYEPASGHEDSGLAIWNSSDPNGGTDGISTFPEQYRRLPEIVEVTIEVIDSDGVLAKEDQNPVQIRRLIELPQ